MPPTTGKELSARKPSGSPPVQCWAGEVADRSRQPVILEPPPIGHLIEFLLRAANPKSGFPLFHRPYSLWHKEQGRLITQNS